MANDENKGTGAGAVMDNTDGITVIQNFPQPIMMKPCISCGARNVRSANQCYRCGSTVFTAPIEVTQAEADSLALQLEEARQGNVAADPSAARTITVAGTSIPPLAAEVMKRIGARETAGQKVTTDEHVDAITNEVRAQWGGEYPPGTSVRNTTPASPPPPPENAESAGRQDLGVQTLGDHDGRVDSSVGASAATLPGGSAKPTDVPDENETTKQPSTTDMPERVTIQKSGEGAGPNNRKDPATGDAPSAGKTEMNFGSGSTATIGGAETTLEGAALRGQGTDVARDGIPNDKTGLDGSSRPSGGGPTEVRTDLHGQAPEAIDPDRLRHADGSITRTPGLPTTDPNANTAHEQPLMATPDNIVDTDVLQPQRTTDGKVFHENANQPKLAPEAIKANATPEQDGDNTPGAGERVLDPNDTGKNEKTSQNAAQPEQPARVGGQRTTTPPKRSR